VPLDIADFIFVTNKGRKFGPFTKQVTKLLHDVENSKKKNSYELRQKLIVRKICSRVDHPQSLMCSMVRVADLVNVTDDVRDDTSFSSWLDGFLCIVKHGKISRITLKFSVYLDCVYRDPNKKVTYKKMSAGDGLASIFTYMPEKKLDENYNLYDYTLEDIRKNMQGKPIKIHDLEYYFDHLHESQTDQILRDSKHILSSFDGSAPAPDDIVSHPVIEIQMPPILPPQPPPLPEEALFQPPIEEAEENGAVNDAVAANNGDEQNIQMQPEANNNLLAEEAEDDAVVGAAVDEEGPAYDPDIDVWDALINDDLRQIGDVYSNKNIFNPDDYLQ